MRAKVRAILSAFKGEKSELIPMLQAIQQEVGYLPEEGMEEVASFARLKKSKVYGTATFYSQFYFTPQGDHEIKVCLGTACHVKGAMNIMDTLERELGVCCGETTADGIYSLKRVNCVGSCALAPVVMIGDEVYGRVETKNVKGVLEKSAARV